MIQRSQNKARALLHGLRTSRQIHDQGLFADPQDAPRLSIARSVICMDFMRMYSAIPGAFRSATASVASGVWSRMENPVPPLVITRSTLTAVGQTDQVML